MYERSRKFSPFSSGGYLRQEFYRKGNPLLERIIGEVDGLIEETDFDLEAYLELTEANQQATSAISGLWARARTKGKQLIQPHLDQMGSSSDARKEMIAPLFDRLILKGYTEEQLRQ